MFDYEGSLALAQKMGHRCWPSECWSNAVQALRLYHKNAFYVEGWAIASVFNNAIVIEHGWIELEDGIILDPTYVVAHNGDEERMHFKYFPGVRYTLDELQGIRLRSLPRVWRTSGWGGWGNDAYKQAYVNAYRSTGVDLSP